MEDNSDQSLSKHLAIRKLQSSLDELPSSNSPQEEDLAMLLSTSELQMLQSSLDEVAPSVVVNDEDEDWIENALLENLWVLTMQQSESQAVLASDIDIDEIADMISDSPEVDQSLNA
jgi:heptaprenylglyceryl phosphate synthase